MTINFINRAKIATLNQLFTVKIIIDNGMWPSGKAPGFGPGIRGFESLHPSQDVHQT